jgi:chemotaxis protein MotB
MSTPQKKVEESRPIIIRRKKIIAGGHHGGAWKVAYADFVTALMAFFLVMWLVASANDQQKTAIFDYFKNPSMAKGSAPIPAPGQDGPGGASTSPIELRGGLTASAPSPITESGAGTPISDKPEQVRRLRTNTGSLSEADQLQALKSDLQEAIEKSKALEAFKDQLLIDITPEGLRIQIVDAQNRPMFDLAGTLLKDYATALLLEVGKYLNTVPNRITISGHTDETPFTGRRPNYTNWELSADRANAARRALIDGGLAYDKIARVIGMSSYVLLDKANPRNPVNRRISVIVMTKAAEDALLRTDTPSDVPSNTPSNRPIETTPAR